MSLYNYYRSNLPKEEKNNKFNLNISASRKTTRAKGNKILRRKTRRLRGSTVKGAQNKLKRFRQATLLAVAVTGMLLLVIAPEDVGYSQNIEKSDSALFSDETETGEESVPDDKIASKEKREISKAAKDEAINTFRNLWEGFYSNLPKILVAVIVLVLAWLSAKFVRWILLKTISVWSNSDAIITLSGIVIWLLAIGMAVSVVAGDIRALVGSLGLVGLALSWSLQTPIESFTAWLQNSFQRYYRVGDRINVGDVFGDVYKIDFLTTTVWEIGAPYRPGFVQAEQPTGRLVTFPNSEILSGIVVNLTRDFPYVWDELAVAVANESHIGVCMKVIERVANDLLQDYMKTPALKYAAILKKANLDYKIAERPEVFVATQDSWTEIIVRYLVGARERRKWKSELNIKLAEELAKSVYKGKIIPVYPRQQVQFIQANGSPFDPEFFKKVTPNEKDK